MKAKFVTWLSFFDFIMSLSTEDKKVFKPELVKIMAEQRFTLLIQINAI